MISSMRDQRAQAEICPPNFWGNVTPEDFRPLISEGSGFWLQVDETGEEAMFTMYGGGGGPQPITLEPTESLGTFIARAGNAWNGTGQLISRDHPNQALVTPGRINGRLMHLIGGIVVHRSETMAAHLVNRFKTP